MSQTKSSERQPVDASVNAGENAAEGAAAGASRRAAVSAHGEVPASGDRLAYARAAYDAVPLYDPKRAPVALDLTDNTNLWGVPPAAERTMREMAVSSVTRYPSLYAAELKQELAAYVGVTADMIVTGSGSDDVLDSAMRAFGETGDVVAGSEPSFAMIPIFSQMNALRYIGVTELASQQPDVNGLLSPRARITYLCSPNNPTGTLMARAMIERVVNESSGIVFIDEAYAEFAGVSSVDLVAQSERVLVIRTMSKAFGLAGLRVGYAIGQPRVVREVEKSRGPYKLSALAEQMAVAALRHDTDWVKEHVTLAVSLRERLRDALFEIGLAPMESAANFVCVPVANCVAVGQALRARGVAVRPFPALPHVGDALRISVGPWSMVQPMLDALVPAMREVNG